MEPKIIQFKRKSIFQTCTLGFHINFQGCKQMAWGVLVTSKFYMGVYIKSWKWHKWPSWSFVLCKFIIKLLYLKDVYQVVSVRKMSMFIPSPLNPPNLSGDLNNVRYNWGNPTHPPQQVGMVCQSCCLIPNHRLLLKRACWLKFLNQTQ